VLSDYVARATSREAHERAASIDKQEAQKVPSAASQQQTGTVNLKP
jgi:glutathione S-transferase